MDRHPLRKLKLQPFTVGHGSIPEKRRAWGTIMEYDNNSMWKTTHRRKEARFAALPFKASICLTGLIEALIGYQAEVSVNTVVSTKNN